MKINALLHGNKLIFLSLLGFFLTFLSYRLGVAYNSVLIAFVVWRPSANSLPAILILLLGYVNFIGQGTFDALGLEQVETNVVLIGGVGLGSILVLNCMLGLVVCFSISQNKLKLNKLIVILLFIAWIVWCAGATVSAIWGKFSGYNGWADPVRSALFGASVFYAALIHRYNNFDLGLQKLYYVIVVCMGACLLGHFYHRLIFIAVSIIPYWSLCRFFSLPGNFGRLVSVIGLALSFAVAFGFTLGGLNSTFTLKGLWALSFLGYVVFEVLKIRKLRTILVTLPGLAFLVTASFLTFVLKFGYQLRVGSRSLNENTPFFERLQAKIFDDRFYVWDAVYHQFVKGVHLFNPAGEPLVLHHVVKGDILVSFGSHNIMLDLIRKAGLIGGIAAMGFIFLALTVSMRVFEYLSGPERALVWGSFVTLTFGGLNGHYPLAQNAIFWVLLPLGLGLRYYGYSAGIVTSMARHPAAHYSK